MADQNEHYCFAVALWGGTQNCAAASQGTHREP